MKLTRWSVGIPLGLAFSAGLAVSLQVFTLGRLASHTGSPQLAATANTIVGAVALLAIAIATRASARAVHSVKAGARVRAWQLLMGANGGLFLIVASSAVPKVGVALFTVAAVCGQTLGSLAVDRLALSPAGRRHFTTPRLVGAALAIVAVGISALGSHDDLHLGWLGLTVLVGAGTAVQQAALGHVARATGEPLVAGWVNMTVAAVVVVVAWAIVKDGAVPGGWSAPLVQWLVPGLCGALALVIFATVVKRLGVLRLMLAAIAGQSVCALLLDAVAPTAGEVITVQTLVSVALTLVAVTVSGLGRGGPQTAAQRAG